jgi:AraC-like DNA-binding protein
VKAVRTQHRSPGLSNEHAVVLLNCAESHGADVSSCLKSMEIKREDILNHGAELTAEQELSFIDTLIKQLAAEPALLGYEVGLECKLQHFGVIGQAMLSSRTVGDALNVGIRYCQKAFHFSTGRSEIRGDVLTMHVKSNVDVSLPLENFLLARDLGTIVSIYQLVSGDQNKNVFEVGLHADVPALKSQIEQSLKCSVSLSPRNVFIKSSANNLATPMPLGCNHTANILEMLCYQQIYATPSENKQHSIREQIQTQLAHANNFHLTREEAAQKLCMSSRTLARHLQQSGYNWRELIAELRIEKAKQLLLNESLSILDVAEQVGFSSSSSLSLAFSRATGISPRKFRENSHCFEGKSGLRA